jgi:organic hydroperoxide reductase OsmC/OhrA
MMQPYPHIYTAAAGARPQGTVGLTSPGLPEIATASPPEFDGPGGVWSPETLLCASIADCFVLSFRAIARASKVEWSELACRVEGVLERVEGVAQFTRYTTFASLKVPSEAAGEKARRLLEKAEHVCLISNSLRGERILVTEVVVGG